MKELNETRTKISMMKNKCLTVISAVLIAFISLQSWVVQAAESNWREQFDQGLMQEEVHQDLEKAVEHYQGIVNAFDEQRSVIAMSVYRLAECLRKLGRMDEASPLYARIINEFPDQESIALLSQRFVPAAAPLPEIKTPDDAIINHPTSLKLLISQLRHAEPEAAMQTLTQTTGDSNAGALLSQYRKTQAELAQLRIRYLDKWPGIQEKLAQIASLNDQMKAHVEQAIKNLGIRLVALETVKTSEEEEPSTRSQRLTDDPRTLRLLIEELEKAPTEVAMQMLIQKTDLKLPSQLQAEKTSYQLSILRNSRIFEKQHPNLRSVKARLASLLEQESDVIKQSIQQLKIKLKVLERTSGLSNAGESKITRDLIPPSRTAASIDFEDREDLRRFLKELPKMNYLAALEALALDLGYQPALNILEKVNKLEVKKLEASLNSDDSNSDEWAEQFEILKKATEEAIQRFQEIQFSKLTILERAKRKEEDDKNPETIMLGELIDLANQKPDLLTHYNQTGLPPIHEAAQKGYTRVVRFLIKKVDVNSRDRFGKTALHYAAQNGDVELMKELLQVKGIETNAMEPYHATPLHLAAEKGFLKIAQSLVKAGADVNQSSALNAPTISSSGAMNRRFLAQLRSGLPLNRDAKSHSFIGKNQHYAALLTEGNTPLHFSSKNGFIELTELLLANGADVNAINRCGLTPLLYLLAHSNIEPQKQIEFAKLLLRHGADPNILGCVQHPGNRISGRLDKESLYFKKRSSSLLPLHGINNGLPLNSALNGSVFEEGKFSGPDLPVGWTSPLHLAVVISDDLTRLLLEYKANINEQDYRGRTPIHELMMHETQSSIRDQLALFAAGEDEIDPIIRNVNIDLKDSMGYRPLDLGFFTQKDFDVLKGMLALLPEDKRKQIAYETFWNQLPFVSNQSVVKKMLPDLLPNFSNIIHEVGPEGLTPLEYAFENERPLLMEWLSKHGDASLMTPKLQTQLEQLEEEYKHIENVLKNNVSKTVPDQSRTSRKRKKLKPLDILRSLKNAETR